MLPCIRPKIALHDLRTKHDLTLFPPKQESPIRQARTQRLESFYQGHEEWCNKNNDPCDPAYFDSALEGDAKARFGDRSLENLLKPEALQKIFKEEPAPRP